MQICRKVAGYSYGRADLVRRAMAKKKKDIMEKERNAFIYGTETNCGAVNNGVSEEAAIRIFEEMSSFATYAFNKSHAAAYAYLAYQTAYLKHYYYKEYMVALLTSVLDQPHKLTEYISDLKLKGVSVLPPDVNNSFLSFSIEGGNIRFGLLAIKNIGRGFINDIINERKERPFRDITDFIKRLHGKDMNKRALEALIKAGAFDRLPHNRRQLLCSYEHIYDTVSDNKNRNLDGQLGFFDFVEDNRSEEINIAPMEEYPKTYLMQLEKEAFGFYATGHPLDAYDKLIRLNGYLKISDITGENKVKDGLKAGFIALVTGRKTHVTKTNRQMCFVTLEDSTGEIEGIVFDDVYARSSQLIAKNDTPLIIHGTVSVSSSGDEPPKVIVNSVESAVNIKIPDFTSLFIQLGSGETEKLSRIASVLEGKKGQERVRIAFSDTRQVSAIKGIENVNITKELLDKLAKICGKSNIIVK